MTFLRTLFMWTGVVVWYVLLVLGIARLLSSRVWRHYRDDGTPYDVDDETWVRRIDDDDEDDGWDGWSKWPGGGVA